MAVGASPASLANPDAADASVVAPPGSARPAVRAAPPSPAGNQATHRVLCIDDDAATRLLVATLLQRRPQWALTVAEDVGHGLALARQLQPHLLLLGAPLAEANAPIVGNVVLLGAPVGPATADWRHLAKPLKVPEFFALLDQMEQST